MAKKKKKVSKRAPKKATTSKGGREAFFKRLKVQHDRSPKGGRFKFPEGKTTLRFLTFEHDGEEHLFADKYMHWKLGENGRGSMLCPGENECVICEAFQDGRLTWEKHSEHARKIEYEINAVIRGKGNEPDRLIQLPISSARMYNAIYKFVKSVDEYGDVLDPKKGRDFSIDRTGLKWNDTKYDYFPGGSTCPVGGNFKPVDLWDRVPEAPERKEAREALSLLLD